MNTTRKEFLGAATLAAVFAGCKAAKAENAIRPTKFPPRIPAGLEARPDFWKVRPLEIMEFCEGAKKCSRKEVICHTPLGYPVHALFYGDFNEPAPQTNFSAGTGSTHYKNYYGRDKAEKQTFLLVTGIHGAEPECVAGTMNLLQMLETGKDFRGETDAELLELIGKYRLIVVPCVNMDGRAISPDHLRGVKWDEFRRVSQGEWKDGTRIGWRGSKSWFPLPLEKVNYPGGYPNSEGYNIMHDATPGDIRTEEAKALLKLAARWRADMILNGHSYESAPSIIMNSAVDSPANTQRGRELRYKCNLAIKAAGLTASNFVPPEKDRASSEKTNLNTMLAMACGGVTLTLENSVSYDRPDREDPKRAPNRKYTFAELMAPVAICMKAIMRDGLEKPFVNRGPDKVLGD